MFLKNTLKNFLVTALFVSSIAISTNAEAARKPQLSTKATVAICLTTAAVVIAGLAVIAGWVITKSYFVSKRAEKHLDLLKKYNKETKQPSSTEQVDIEKSKEEDYKTLKDAERELYLKTICSSPKSLSNEYPTAWMENDLHENSWLRTLKGFFSSDSEQTNQEIDENMPLLRKSKIFTDERKEYNEKRIERKSRFHSSWGDKLSGLGNLLTGFANVKTAQANEKIAQDNAKKKTNNKN